MEELRDRKQVLATAVGVLAGDPGPAAVLALEVAAGRAPAI